MICLPRTTIAVLVSGLGLSFTHGVAAHPGNPSAATAAAENTSDADTDAVTEAALDALDLPNPTENRDDKALDLYGFADFTYTHILLSETNRWRGTVSPHPSMGIGNLNIYMRGNLSERVRSLVEFRLLYLPNGNGQVQPDGVVAATNTTVQDPLELGRNLRWGGVSIERAWLEFELHELLTIRAGQFLTPYGIWNVDHGSPTIIAARRPFVVTQALFPERQTGLELYGRLPVPGTILGYHLTLSNGRGPTEEYLDQDSSKAVGGRLFATIERVGELTLGTSTYFGRRTNSTSRWTIDAAGVRRLQIDRTENAQEASVAFDLSWRWRAVHLQGEYISRRTDHADDARPRGDTPAVAFVPDHRRWGAYGLVGYRLPFWGLMPYLLLERLHIGSGELPKVAAITGGLNARPMPSVVLKLEVQHAWFPDALPTSFGQSRILGIAAQTAWVF